MFCQCCGGALESNFKFCPHCGQIISTNGKPRAISSKPSSAITSGASSSSSPRLPELAALINSAKEKERSSFFVRKSGSKRSKVVVPSKKEVKIIIAVMENAKTIKRGDSLPLQVPDSSTPDEILRNAVEKHAAFNKRFNAKISYSLVFKDGTEVKTIPGTNPPEPFSLRRYKEVSGYGYSQIRLYLVPLVEKRMHDLKAVIAESETESVGEDEYYDDEEDDDVLHQSTFEVASIILPQDGQPSSSTSMPQPQTGACISTPSIQSYMLQDEQPAAAVPLSSSCLSVNQSSSSAVPKVQCPLCFDNYPIDEVENHAAECSGAFGLAEENTLDIEPAGNLDPAVITIDDEKSDVNSLATCIKKLKESGLKSEMEMVRITVRRKMLWQDFKRARNRYYQPDRRLKITFAGEPAVDDGGPKREFFSGKIKYGCPVIEQKVTKLHHLLSLSAYWSSSPGQVVL